MNNLEKLLKFLLSDSDIKEIAQTTNINEETVVSFSQDVFARIVPNDFTKQDGSHIEEKDLRALVANFNLLLKEENLKPLMINGVKKYDLETSEASALIGAILPVIHNKIKTLTKPQEKETKEAKENKEVNDIFSSISQRAQEDLDITSEKKVKKLKKTAEPKEETIVQDSFTEVIDDGILSPIEKGCIYAVVISLIVIIVLLTVVLIKINL